MAVMVTHKRQNAFGKGEKRRKRALVRNLYIGLATLANLDLRGDNGQFKEGVLPPKAHNRDQGWLAQDDSSTQASRVPTATRPNHRPRMSCHGNKIHVGVLWSSSPPHAAHCAGGTSLTSGSHAIILDR